MPSPSSRLALPSLGILVLLAGACGGGDDGADETQAAAANGDAGAAGSGGSVASAGGSGNAGSAGAAGGASGAAGGGMAGGAAGKGVAGAGGTSTAGAAGKGGAGAAGASSAGAAGAAGVAGKGGTAGAAGKGGTAGAAGGPGAGAGGGVNPDCVASTLYGKAGELWKPDGRIVDAGWVGYHTGKDPLPDVAVTATSKSVTDFGATPDDDTDDTKAFLAAADAVSNGVISVPAGKFILTERVYLKKSHVVLRGAGVGKTVLYMPKSLGDVYGLTFDGAGHSNWSFGGGFLTVQGSDGGKTLTTVTAKAARGATTLTVASASGITAGQWIRIVQTDAGGSMLKAFHEGYYPGNEGEDGGKELYHFYSPVKSVQGNAVTLERPLPFPIDTAWSPTVKAMAPTVQEVGIEHLTMKFAGTPYPGHFKEHGYNAIQVSGAHHAWVRDVEILNADYGVSLGGCFFSTVTDVILDTDFDRGALVGHHGLNSSGGTDLLFTRFDVRKTFVHDLTVDGYAFGTVWSRGKGVDLNMDHHGRAPYGTLWTALDMGAGNRPFASGGSAGRMPHSGAHSTYWNLKAKKDIPSPPSDFGPLLSFVAVAGQKTTLPSNDWSIEAIPAAKLCQEDLHEAMLAARP